eukprot:1392513-Amorphochlora_amoeboformis.AAC.6
MTLTKKCESFLPNQETSLLALPALPALALPFLFALSYQDGRDPASRRVLAGPSCLDVIRTDVQNDYPRQLLPHQRHGPACCYQRSTCRDRFLTLRLSISAREECMLNSSVGERATIVGDFRVRRLKKRETDYTYK